MKKSILFVLALVSSVYMLNAQTTVTNSIIVNAGDVLKTKQATSIGSAAVTAAGPNQTWDFSDMVGGDLDSSTVMAASTGSFAGLFPTANILYPTSILPGDNYVNASANAMEIVGFAGDVLNIGVVVPSVFDNPLTLVQTPMDYQDTYSDNASFTTDIKVSDFPTLESYLNDTLGVAAAGIVIDSLRALYSATATYEVDAWGSMTVPESGTFDVLRLKQRIVADLGAEFKGTFANIPFDWTNPASIPNFPAIPFLGEQLTINYVFYADGQKEAIAIIETSATDSTQISEVTYKAGQTTSIFGFASKGIDLPTVKVYPNPVIETLNLQLRDFPTGNYTVKIFNIVGRELMSESRYITGNEDIRMNVSDLRKGTYLYSVVDAKGNTLVTKRVMIVRP